MKDRIWQFWAYINSFGYWTGFWGFISFLLQKYSSSEFYFIKNKYFNYGIFLRKKSSDFTIFREVFLSQDYNFHFLDDLKTIIDCGANIGLTAIFFSKHFPNAKIICIEPDRDNYLLLLKNTIHYSKILCINAGIWHKNQKLIIDNPQAQKSAIRLKEMTDQSENFIFGKSILEVMRDNDLKQIDLIKIDIEGSEIELLANNSEEWLLKTKSLVIELHDRIRENCFNALIKAISNREISMSIKGNNLMCIFNDTK